MSQPFDRLRVTVTKKNHAKRFAELWKEILVKNAHIDESYADVDIEKLFEKAGNKYVLIIAA